MADLIVTIDGPAGSGKSTVSQLLAEKLSAAFLDTGAMYRAVTLAAMRNGTDLTDTQELLDVLTSNKFEFTIDGILMRVSVNGVDATDDIRLPEVTANVKYVASEAKLRSKLVEMQRHFAADCKKIVTEGRDQGTVVFPDADYKFYLEADISERTRRRQQQLKTTGKELPIEEIKKNIEKRDHCDTSRKVGALTPAEDAIIIDTTNLGITEVVKKMLSYIKKGK